VNHHNDNRGACAHCAIHRALDDFHAAHSPVDMDDLIDDVTAVLCELIAFWDDRGMRRASVKQIVELIPKRVAAFRENQPVSRGKVARHAARSRPVKCPARRLVADSTPRHGELRAARRQDACAPSISRDYASAIPRRGLGNGQG
jgi:hypothetical protein